MSLMPAYGHSQPPPVADLSPPLIPQPLLPEPSRLILRVTEILSCESPKFSQSGITE